MPGPIDLNFSNLVRMAEAAPDKSIIVKDGGFRSVGKVGAFFASKTECRQAAQSFMDGIKAQYGDAVAFTLAPELRALQSSGKPLSARKARDLLRQAKELSQGLTQVNTDMARKFLAGSGIPGDTRSLDAAFADYCQANGLVPQNEEALKKTIADAVLMLAKTSGHMMSFAELGDAVRGWNTTPDIIIAREASDRLNELADTHGLDAEQKASLEETAFMAASFNSGGSRPTARQLADTLQNDLTVQCYLFTCGAPTVTDYALLNCLPMAAATPHFKDFLSLIPQIGKTDDPVYMISLRNIGRIRELQPEGVPTRQTIWKACFNEDLPASLQGAARTRFNNAVYDKVKGMFLTAAEGNEMKAMPGITAFSTGVSLEKALASVKAPVSLTMDDLAGKPTLTLRQRLPTLEEAEKSLAKDLCRRGTPPHNAIAGYVPVITFGAPGQDAEAVRIQDVTGLDESQKQAFYGQHPSPVSHGLVERARALCGNNDAQLRQVVLSMGQSGMYPLSTTSFVAGFPCDEHSPVDIDIRRLDDGTVTMRFHTPESSPLDGDYSYSIAPDGSSTLTAFRMQAR